MKHGVRVTEQATAIISPVKTEASIPIFFGIAPVHKIAEGSVNRVELCYSYDEAVGLFGFSEDFSIFGISEAIHTAFRLFKTAPIMLVNVFDPAIHRTNITEMVTFGADNKATLIHEGVLAAPEVRSTDGETTYIAGVDYSFDLATGQFSRLIDGAIHSSATVQVDYVFGDPSLVTSEHIIGGISTVTGKKTGLALLDTCFARFGLVPETVVAPGWTHDNEVNAVMTAAASSINGLFPATVVIDIDDTVAVKYSDVNEYKNSRNLVDSEQILVWGKLGLGGKIYHQSTQLACLIQRTTAENEGIPYESPSNKNYQCDSLIVNEQELWLGPDEAAYLNSIGVVTALNFVGGWKCWGNYTAAYPSNTDVKDYQIVGRHMFHWVAKEIILTYWQKLDAPMNKRNIESIVDSLNIRLNGLTAREFILGGRVEFNSDENPVTDLMLGSLLFRVWFTFPGPMQDMNFLLAYDPEYLSVLFS